MTVTGATLRFDADCGDRAQPAPAWMPRSTACRGVLGTAARAARQRAVARRHPGRRAAQPISRCAAASTCPSTWASRATFTLGQFGGHGGRALRTGDVLRLHRAGSRTGRLPRASRPRSGPQYAHDWQIARHRRSARRAGLLHARGHRRVLRRRLGSALQLESHRRAADRAQAAVGAHRWRRGGPASLQHPRQCLRHRQHRLHRRHAGDPRARRPEPRWLRLPGDDRRGRICGRSASCGPATSCASGACAKPGSARRQSGRSCSSCPPRPRTRRCACGARARATCWWNSARQRSTWCCASRCRRCSRN